MGVKRKILTLPRRKSMVTRFHLAVMVERQPTLLPELHPLESDFNRILDNEARYYSTSDTTALDALTANPQNDIEQPTPASCKTLAMRNSVLGSLQPASRLTENDLLDTYESRCNPNRALDQRLYLIARFSKTGKWGFPFREMQMNCYSGRWGSTLLQSANELVRRHHLDRLEVYFPSNSHVSYFRETEEQFAERRLQPDFHELREAQTDLEEKACFNHHVMSTYPIGSPAIRNFRHPVPGPVPGYPQEVYFMSGQYVSGIPSFLNHQANLSIKHFQWIKKSEVDDYQWISEAYKEGAREAMLTGWHPCPAPLNQLEPVPCRNMQPPKDYNQVHFRPPKWKREMKLRMERNLAQRGSEGASEGGPKENRGEGEGEAKEDLPLA